MSSIKAVAIAAITGKMGRLITKAILDRHPGIEIHGICRSPEKVPNEIASHPKVKIFQASDDDVPAIRRALTGCQVCICCYLGDNDLMVDGQKRLIDACIHEGVQRYIASDWSLDYRPLNVGDLPPKDPMILIHAYLKEKQAAGQIKPVHILNGAFTEVITAPFSGILKSDGTGATIMYWGTGDEPIEVTTMPDAAAFTAEVAADPAAVGEKNFLSDRKSAKELAQLYEKVYGIKPRVEMNGSIEDLKNVKDQKFQEAPANPYAWMGYFYQFWMLKGVTNLGKLDNAAYPSVHATTVESFMKQHTKDTVTNAMSMI